MNGVQHEGTGVRPEGEHAAERPDGRSLGHLIRELTKESAALVRAEVALAKAELGEKLTDVQRSVSALASGAVVLMVGLVWLAAAGVAALALVWPLWLSALVVGGAVALIGIFLLAGGKRGMSAEKLTPSRTVASLKETGTMAKEQVA